MAVMRFDRASLPATPWKNSGGFTREIACHPPGAGLDRFDWRVSIAHVASDGPFSAFAGVDRVITLLEGGGVHLQGLDGRFDHRLDTPLAPFAFAGDTPVTGTLLAGDCHDFNVMTRRSVCYARVRVYRGAVEEASAPSGVLLAVRGHWHAGAMSLTTGEGLWWDEDSERHWPLSSEEDGAALLAVTIHPEQP